MKITRAKALILLFMLTISTLPAKSKDFLLSLAVPGFAQIKDGRGYGYSLLAAEALLIGGQLYLKSEANLLRDDSYTYALKFAHINPGDYDSEFLKNLGKYESSGYDAMGYNSTVRNQAVMLYPDDPEGQQLYIEANAYGDDKYWDWDSQTHKSEYNRMRNDAQDLESFAKLAFGVTILNHLVSGFDVLRYNASESRARFSMDYRSRTPQLKLSVKF